MTEEVFVIPDYPHVWWRHPEIKAGSLVRLDDSFGRKGDYRVYEVVSVWDEGAKVRLHERNEVQERSHKEER